MPHYEGLNEMIYEASLLLRTYGLREESNVILQI